MSDIGTPAWIVQSRNRGANYRVPSASRSTTTLRTAAGDPAATMELQRQEGYYSFVRRDVRAIAEIYYGISIGGGADCYRNGGGGRRRIDKIDHPPYDDDRRRRTGCDNLFALRQHGRRSSRAFSARC